MKCVELLAALNEYVDGTVDPAICEAFEAHMARCNPCQVVVDNIRKTLTLFKEGQPHALPVECRQRLRSAPRAALETNPSSGRQNRRILTMPSVRSYGIFLAVAQKGRD